MNIVYALTQNVYEWLLPSIRSLAEKHPGAHVFILCEDDAFPFELPEFDHPITIINVSGQKFFSANGVNYHNAFTYINLLKVRYPTILKNLDKVIHLDIDTIICDKIDAMWNADLTDKWFAAVPEYTGVYKPFGNDYYNMGVAVINLAQMREDGIEQPMQDYLNNVKQPWADQDAWNKYGLEMNKISKLDIRYNESQMTGYTNNPAIVHFCGVRNWYTTPNMFRVGYLNKYR